MTGWPDKREDGPVRAAFHLFDGLDETAHDVALGAGQKRNGEPASGRHEPGGDRFVFERNPDELGLHADLDHEVRRHHVHVVAVATPDQVEARGERPQDPAAVTVELVVGVAGRAHPKMPPTPEFPVLPAVVVVTGDGAGDDADALERLLVERLRLDGVALGLGQEALVGGAGVVALVRRRAFEPCTPSSRAS